MLKYLTISPWIFHLPGNFSQVAPEFLPILHKTITKITQKSKKYLKKLTFKFYENFSNSFYIDCCAWIIRICVVSNHFYYWHRYSLSEISEKFCLYFFRISFKFLWKNISNFSWVVHFCYFFVISVWMGSIILRYFNNCPESIDTYRYFIVSILPITNIKACLVG